jgi:potassium-transporting ATPase KdpC subunit
LRGLNAELRASAVGTLLLAAVCCGIYPLVVWGIGQAAFPEKANGSLVRVDGTVVGSSLIAQSFREPRYFHPRPSAAGRGYDAANSGGSNLGPLSKNLIDAVRERVAAYRAENGLPPGAEVPADAVTSSASGLDPDISVENALLQARRVAAARKIPQESVRRMVRAHTEERELWILGEPRVNVLMLNLELDRGHADR